MGIEKLKTQEIEHDLEMVYVRFSGAVESIINMGEDITPMMAYLLDYIDSARIRLNTFIEQH